ncbi:uncharacterized protein LOC141702673 [Apium graveolens]|uniref:uncharacterized protein LOC141702673 n=1 Tax=Apium graveolens TaxID=4045 RepID=UPI003D7BED5B
MTDTSKSKAGPIGLNYPVLAKNNYFMWSLKMKVFMHAQGVWEAASTDDKVVMAAIYQGISEDMLLSFAEKKIAKQAYEAIKTQYMGANRVKDAKVKTLRADFESLTMKETDEMEDFYIKLSGIVTYIRMLGEDMAESNIVKKLLRVVPSKLVQIASTIEQFGDKETISLEEVVGRLKAHEERVRA